MPELKHTPGPWKVLDKSYHSSIINPGIDAVNSKQSVVLVGCDNSFTSGIIGDNEDQQTANAKLIAAAPDLLEALQALLNVDALNPHEQFAAESKAVQAIQKATH